MSQDKTPAAETETAPDADVMRRVADALEATETGTTAANPITVATGDGGPLLPRRGS